MDAGDSGPARELAEFIAALPLIDHHVHGCYSGEVSRARFEESINEGSPDPIPGWMTQFDSQLGFAIRAHCAPLLGIEAHASADEYWAARSALGFEAVSRRLLHAAGVSDWVVDTGFATTEILGLDGLAAASAARAHEIVRLEQLAESLATSGVTADGYAEAFRAQLSAAFAAGPGRTAPVGVKTVVAYRSGFDICWDEPSAGEVRTAASRWLASGSAAPRLADPVLLRFGILAAAELDVPIQIHTGFGDRDLDLHRVDPLLLLPLLRQPSIAAVPVTLLHCYPFHRQAGYLAQAFENVYCDVGLALNYVGVRAGAVLAESLELAPFAKVLFSSDAWGPPELHYLGAHLWRRAAASVLGGWVENGEWSLNDAKRVAELMGRGNAGRIYRLPSAQD